MGLAINASGSSHQHLHNPTLTTITTQRWWFFFDIHFIRPTLATNVSRRAIATSHQHTHDPTLTTKMRQWGFSILFTSYIYMSHQRHGPILAIIASWWGFFLLFIYIIYMLFGLHVFYFILFFIWCSLSSLKKWKCMKRKEKPVWVRKPDWTAQNRFPTVQSSFNELQDILGLVIIMVHHKREKNPLNNTLNPYFLALNFMNFHQNCPFVIHNT